MRSSSVLKQEATMALGFELFSLKALQRVASIFCLLSCVVVCQSNGHGPVTVPPPITHSPPHGGGSSAHAVQMDMSPFLQSGGIFPNLAATAASGPKRSECGIGALFPWADNLYMVSDIVTCTEHLAPGSSTRKFI